jgi:hypothetical protein
MGKAGVFTEALSVYAQIFWDENGSSRSSVVSSQRGGGAEEGSELKLSDWDFCIDPPFFPAFRPS